MSRYRLYPTSEQEQAMLVHCSHARYVWNLCIEQLRMRHHRQKMPNQAQRSKQLTEARREFDWLGAGSAMVQQQALRDFDQSLENMVAGTHRAPGFRKKGRNEAFRVVGWFKLRKINRRWSTVSIPHVGYVKFRRSRGIPAGVKSFRVTLDRSGRWHVSFAVIPDSILAPGDGSVIGVDRGVTVSLAYSDGTLLCRVYARNTDRRKNFIEQASTELARRFDVIRVEDLSVRTMVLSARGTVDKPGRNVRAKSALNRGILASGWGMFLRRLQDKAPGRVEKINPAFTSMTCAVCGTVDPRNRNRQAFRCVDCGHQAHADVNAAQVIAAGRAVRGAKKSLALKRVPA